MVVVGGGDDGREVEVVVISMSGGFRILTSGWCACPLWGLVAALRLSEVQASSTQPWFTTVANT